MLSKGVRPQNPAQHLRGSSRRCSGAGQDRGVQAIMPRQETCRDAVCAFEAYPTARPAAIARAMRCPVRVHVGSDCAEPSQACQVGRPATTTRPCVLCVTLQASVKSSVSRPAQSSGWQRTASTNGISRPAPSVCRLLQQNRHKTDMPNLTMNVAFDPGCVKTPSFNLSVEHLSQFRRCGNQLHWQLLSETKIEKTILCIVVLRTFSHSPHPNRTWPQAVG